MTLRRRHLLVPRLWTRIHPHIQRPIAHSQDGLQIARSEVCGASHGRLADDFIPEVVDLLRLRLPLDDHLPHEADELAVLPVGVEVLGVDF